MKADPKEIRRILQHAKICQDSLEREINAEPTGEKRNILTEANIHLLESISKLAEFINHDWSKHG